MSEAKPREANLRLIWNSQVPQPAPIYANYAHAAFTPEDFTINLGWYGPPPVLVESEDGTINLDVEPVARVVLPVNLLRNFIALLQLQIEGYEKSFGPIPEHPNKPDWMKQTEEPSDG